MKKYIAFLTVFALSLTIMFTACNKSENLTKQDDLYKSMEADLFLDGDGDFEKVITNPLVKLDDCKYIVAGTIEFIKDGQVVAIIDFGDGTCDDIATKTVGDEVTEFSLNKKDKDGKDFKYIKVIVEPLVKIEGCDYIVSGIIEFYEGDKWVATIDFGDGECDDTATKTTHEGTFEFSLKKGK